MRTNEHRWVAVAGLAFIVLAVAGGIAYPAEPDFVGEPAEVRAFYADNVDGVLAANVAYLVGTAALLWFAGGLSAALARLEGGGAIAARTVFAGAVAGAGLMIAGASVDAVAALRVDERGAIDPQVAAVMWDLNSVLFGLAAPIAFAPVALAVASLALRGIALPRWHGALSALLGVALLVPPINWAAMFAFLFWVPLTGVTLATTAPRPAATERPGALATG